MMIQYWKFALGPYHLIQSGLKNVSFLFKKSLLYLYRILKNDV